MVILFLVVSLVLVTVNYVVITSLSAPDPNAAPPAQLAALGLDVANPLPDVEALEAELGVDLRELFEQSQSEARRRILERLLLSSAVAVVVAGALAWLVAGRVARRTLAPVHRITATARDLSGESLDRRIDLSGPDDELKELADTFDSMLDRLEAAFEARRAFGAYASHELRTPLATLRAEAELVLHDPAAAAESRHLARTAIDTVLRADRLIGSLLTIGRAESGVVAPELLDLATVTGDAVGDVLDVTGPADVDVQVDLATAPVRGDRSLLRSLAANLVANAVRYNRPGGRVDVVVTALGQRAVLVVDNDGPDLSDADVVEMSRPFRRLERNPATGGAPLAHRQGHGLGTSIAHSVATAHHGSVRWERRDGGGVRATVELPLASPTT